MVGATAGSGRILGVGFWGGVRPALLTEVDPPRRGTGVTRALSFSSAMPSPTSSEASFALTLPSPARAVEDVLTRRARFALARRPNRTNAMSASAVKMIWSTTNQIVTCEISRSRNWAA